ncbi:unnamed protein product [Rotaria sp. Silwood2]|nr:unnamed protein product [Rotaria sp. Silwood2]CAF3409322.1 unnamed protein product [Rotaria sp. Silwood2]CAF3958578.1 unnamed protein product [Rotaria sp. Silwood2]CAF4091138.1 unnamed protein product [Rotaria sp. Silwood2]
MTQNLFKNRNGVSWNTIAIPSEVDRISVQHVLEYSFLNLKLKNSFVTKANLDSIKQLFKSWKKCIYALALIIFKLIPDRDVKSKQLAIVLKYLSSLCEYGDSHIRAAYRNLLAKLIQSTFHLSTLSSLGDSVALAPLIGYIDIRILIYLKQQQKTEQ